MSRDLNPRKPSPAISKSSASSTSSLATHSKYKELSDAHPSTATTATVANAAANSPSSTLAAPATASTSSTDPQTKHGGHGKGMHKTSPTPPRINFQSNLIQQIQNSVNNGTASSASRSSTTEEWNHAGRGGRKVKQPSHSNHTDYDRHHAGQHLPHHAKGKSFHAKDSREEGKSHSSFFRPPTSNNGSGSHERPGPRSQPTSSEARKMEDLVGPTDTGPIKGHPSHTAQKAAAHENSKLKESKESTLSLPSQAKDMLAAAETHSKAQPTISSQPKPEPSAKHVETHSTPASGPTLTTSPRSFDLGTVASSASTAAVAFSTAATTTTTTTTATNPSSSTCQSTATLAFDIETPNGTLIRVPFSETDDPTAVALRFCTDHSMLDLLDSLIYHFKDSIRIHAAFQQQ